jgi:uncharacterized protein YceK
MKTICAVLCCFALLSGCATTKNPVYQAYVEKEESGWPVHGYFCGKDIPNLPEGSADAQIKYLESIEPIDVIDDACKKHDICFMRNESIHECNKKLWGDMNNLIERRRKGENSSISMNTKECDDLVRDIASYAMYHAGGFTGEYVRNIKTLPSAVESVLKLPVVVVLDGILLSFEAFIAMLGLPVDRFPDRFFRCEPSEELAQIIHARGYAMQIETYLESGHIAEALMIFEEMGKLRKLGRSLEGVNIARADAALALIKYYANENRAFHEKCAAIQEIYKTMPYIPQYRNPVKPFLSRCTEAQRAQRRRK